MMFRFQAGSNTQNQPRDAKPPPFPFVEAWRTPPVIAPNDGTLITDVYTPPTPPKKWGGNKLGRAIATVAF